MAGLMHDKILQLLRGSLQSMVVSGLPCFFGIRSLLLQEVPALLSLPQGNVGMPIWLIMTGITTGIQGYNRLISKIVPLTAAGRSIDLIPFMVVSHHHIASPHAAHRLTLEFPLQLWCDCRGDHSSVVTEMLSCAIAVLKDLPAVPHKSMQAHSHEAPETVHAMKEVAGSLCRRMA